MILSRLLHTLARYVAGDARVVAFSADLVDFVDVDDATLGPLDVVIGILEQLHDDIFDVFADVTGLGERRGVGDRERDIENFRERLCEKRLAATSRPQKEDVRFGQLDVVGRHARVDALVVVVHSHGEDLLGSLLADHVLVENGLDLTWFRDGGRAGIRLVLLDLFRNDVVAQTDALVANVDRRAGDELLDFLLRFSAKGAAQVPALVVVSSSLHFLALKPKVAACQELLGSSLVLQPCHRKLTAVV